MKRNIPLTLGIVAAALLSMTSCGDDFLNVTPPAQLPIEEYFTKASHVEEAVVAAYDPLQWPDWAMGQYNPSNIMSDLMADQIWAGGADKTDNQFWHLMLNYEAIPTNCMSGLWTDAYSGVKRCNDVLLYLTWVKDMPETQIKSNEAQVRVLRAFYYNWLWKFWGNVPYFEKNLEAPYLGTQLSADEVYNNVIADLEGAIALDALPMTQTGTANQGRVTKAMAYMLYAEMVMYQKDETRYTQALNYMKEIINSGQYELASDFTKIFKVEGEWSKESIFEINYKNENAIRSWGTPQAAGGTVLPRLISPNGWADGLAGHDNGWGFCPVRKETYEMYAPGDTRRDATCWNAAAAGQYNARYQDTGFFLEKYVAQSGGNANHNADGDLNFNNNLRVYRYAETLLNAAELALLTNNTAGAEKWLQEVHHRAGLTDNPALTAENILQERRLEFVGEGKRYWDLIRTGNAEKVLVPDSYGYRTNSWTPTRKYLPIPQSEIDAAQGTLKQNANY